MDEGFPDDDETDHTQTHATRTDEQHRHLTLEPVVCEKRRGPTPHHPAPGRETWQRRRYWRLNRWETRSTHHPNHTTMPPETAQAHAGVVEGD